MPTRLLPSGRGLLLHRLPTVTKQTENEYIRYRVSAKHLTLTSTVFAKALSPKWNEGSTLRDQGSVEAIADGWDSEALLILFNIFHCRFNHLPRQISLELLAKIAVLADYYQCIPAINIFADMWIAAIEHHLPRAFCRGLLLWLLICSLLDRSSDCKELSQIAVTQSKDLIPTLGLPFPGTMIVDLNTKRDKLIGHLKCIACKG